MMRILFFFLLFTRLSFAEKVTLDNQTSYPNKEKLMGIEWARSAQEISERSGAYDESLPPDAMKPLTTQGKAEISLPDEAEYFRVVIWKKGEAEPEFVTSWVILEPSKTYTLKDNQLIPAVLRAGMGC